MKIKFLFMVVAIILLAQSIFSVPYFVRGKLYSSSGLTGTAETDNSFASVTIFREGIVNNIGYQYNGPDPVYPNKIYPAGYEYVTVTAYCYTDVGSYYWGTPAALSQTVRAVFEVMNGANGWVGSTYIGFTGAVISEADLIDNTTDLYDTQLIEIVAPTIVEFNMTHVSISWIGLSPETIIGYGVYRYNVTDNITETAASFVTQTAEAEITYEDTDIVGGKTYGYMLSVKYKDMAGETPLYYESSVKSVLSESVLIPLPSPTITETHTITPTTTVTPTITTTSTVTPTATSTPTSTNTPINQVVKNAKWTAFVEDFVRGNTYNAVNAYATVYEVANGRGSTVEKGWAKYNQAHVLVKKFRSESNWVRNLKTIRLILTPAAQSTARANFVLTVTPVYPLLEEAATYVSEAATVGSTPAANKIKVDNNFINEVATYIAE
jgi:hypothetical protein